MSLSIADEFRSLLGESRLDEKRSAHYPFKNKPKLGPGPGPNKRIFSKANKYKCTCKKYKCRCTITKGPNKGQKRKPFTIDKANKKKYNAKYRAWRAGKKKDAKKKGGGGAAAAVAASAKKGGPQNIFKLTPPGKLKKPK